MEPIKFKPITEQTDVPDEETPEILLKNRDKKYQMLDVVQAWYKEITGKNGPFIRDLATLIASYTQIELLATGLMAEIHIYICNRYLYFYLRNWSNRHCWDESVFRHKLRFIALDTSIDSLFKNGVSSLSIKPVFSRCNKLKHRFEWSFGLAQCSKKKELDTLLHDGNNLLSRHSMATLIVYLRMHTIIKREFPDMYWFVMKHDGIETDGVFFYGWHNDKLMKFTEKNRALSQEEKNGKFEISIAKGGNGQIRLDDWLIDGKYDTNNESSWYFWCIVHLCSCKTNKLPVGVVLQLSCNY